MTFKHKLSRRLALLKDAVIVGALAVVASCEVPSPFGPPELQVAQVIVSPGSLSLEPKRTHQFAAYGRTRNGDSSAVTVTWSVAGGTISSSGLYTADSLQGDYQVQATLAQTTPAATAVSGSAPSAQASGMTGSAVVHVRALSELHVTPVTASVPTGGTQAFAAYGRLNGGDSVVVNVVWGATGGSISSDGLYSAGPTPGGYVVAATGSGFSAEATVVVTSSTVASVSVSPASATLSLGATQQLAASLKDASGSPLSGHIVTWATSNGPVATVDATGLVTAVAPGTATITAASEGRSGSATITVADLPVASVALTPAAPSVYVGATAQLAVTLRDVNGNPLSGRAITWASSDAAVATVSGSGIVTGVVVGTATITATSEGQSGTSTVTVSNVPVASVTLSPASTSVVAGQRVQLTATPKDSVGNALTSRAVTWTSSNAGVATVSTSGLVTGVAAGTTTITTTSEGKTATATVTVTNVPVAAVAISPTTAAVFAGANLPLTATATDAAGNVLSGRAIAWASSAPGVAIVSATGLVTGVAAGAVTITATSEGKTGSAAVTVNLVPTASVSVTPASVNIQGSQTVQLTATPKDSAGNPLTGRTVMWASSAGAVATVSASGLVTGVAAGTATITAASGGKNGTATVTVTPIPVASVTVNPTTASVSVGQTLQLTATPLDANGLPLVGRSIAWASSNAASATVSGSGLVTGVAVGATTIRATSEGKTGSVSLTVQAPPPPTHTGYYVTPTGTASGNGSASQPWDLATALASAAVHPGDTVWLRGGTYRGQFSSRLTGTPTNPIVVRQYPGERATIDGVLYIGTSGTSSVAAYSWYWGFEVMNSNQAGPYLDGVYQFAPGTKLINLVVHDAVATGIYSDVLASNDATEVYGCLSYNNGHMNNNNHGLYVMNKGPSIRKVTDNILFNNWAYGIQMYATYPQVLENLQAVGNVAFNNETIAPTHNNGDILIGGNLQQHGVKGAVISQNYTYRNVGYMTANIGWVSGQQDQDIVLTNNYFVGFVQITDWVTATITGNTIYGTRAFHPGTDGMVSVWGPFGGWTFSNNTLYGDSTPASWGYNDAYPGMSFAPWKATTGLRPGVYVGSAPTGVNVVVRPNQYELGRANIIVYNWARQSTVSVDLSGTLSVGDHYVVQNVQDFYGTPVASGTYGGGSVQLPMAGITPPAPIGRSYTPAPVTGLTFNAFVLMKTP